MITIYWTTGAPKGYSDLLPDEWFKSQAKRRRVKHDIIGPQGRSYAQANCFLDVSGNTAILDYANIGNSEDEIDIGQMKILFTDSSRNRPKEVQWRDHGSHKYLKSRVIINLRESDFEMQEGSPKLVTHLKRERSIELRQRKIRAVLSEGGTLACEACGFSFSKQYRELGEEFCEVHHRSALSSGPRMVSIDHLAILCSNCHRMIHKTDPMMSVESFTKRYVRNYS